MKFIGEIMAWEFGKPPALVCSTRYRKARHIRKAYRVCRRHMPYFDSNHKRPWFLWVTMK